MRTVGLALMIAAAAAAQDNLSMYKRSVKIARIGEPQLSPDGKTVAFTVSEWSISGKIPAQADLRSAHRWLAHLNRSPPRARITSGRAGRPIPSASRYLQSRGAPRSVDHERGRIATEASDQSVPGAGGVLWSPDGNKLVFTSDVYPDCPDDTAPRTAWKPKKPIRLRLGRIPRCCSVTGPSGRPSADRTVGDERRRQGG